MVSGRHPGLCGQRKAFCRSRHCGSIHFSPLSLEMAVVREYNRERLPPDWGGGEGNGDQLSSLPFCFLLPTPEASAMRILFWLSWFPLKGLCWGFWRKVLGESTCQLRGKWNLWASVTSLPPHSTQDAGPLEQLASAWHSSSTNSLAFSSVCTRLKEAFPSRLGIHPFSV